MPEEKIRTWVSHYRLHGIDGLRPKRSKYSAQFKLQVALSRTECTAGLIVHSDQGWHYKMQPYRAMLAQRGVKQSMSRKGNCFDNAVIESFFGTLKAEYFHLESPNSVDELEAGVHDYVRNYNHERIKLRLKGLSPVEYRLKNTA